MALTQASEGGLKISNAGTNGQYLQKQSGNDGGLTWASAPDADKCIEGNTSVEAVDTGSDGHVKITTEGSERVRVDETGRVGIGFTSFNDSAEYLLVGSTTTAANISIVANNSNHSSLNLGDEDDFNIQKIKSDHTNNSLQFFTNDTLALNLDNSQDASFAGNASFAGTVQDSKGNVRNIPQLIKTANYTPVAADAGKHILCNTASITISFNATNFSIGDALTILNNTTGNITISNTAGTSMYGSADGADGNKTLGTRGMCTILVYAYNKSFISGAGLS